MGDSRGAVADEEAGKGLRRRAQQLGAGQEDEAPVGADGPFTDGASGRLAGFVDGDALGHAGVEVAHEDVAPAIDVVGHEVACWTLEKHAAAVGADPGKVHAKVGHRAGGGHGDALRGAGLPVPEVQVRRAVRASGVEVGRRGDEGRVPTVRADAGVVTRPVGGFLVGVDSD